MFHSLLLFELRYHSRTWLFFAILLAFVIFGFAFSALGHRVPNMAANSPYIITNILSLLSLGGIFSAGLFAANAMLRDREALMESFVFTSSIKKWHLLSSRFLGMLMIVLITYLGLFVGMGFALLNTSLMGESLLDFDISTYSTPLLYIAIPNLLIISLWTFSIAAITKNRVGTYLGALGLYILYMIGAMYMKAPWLVSPSPPTESQIILAAKLDPFGLSAFFEQSRIWTLAERNSLSVRLQGNLLYNRLLWLSIALILGAVAYRLYRFRQQKSQSNKTVLVETQRPKASKWVYPTPLMQANWVQKLFAQLKLETFLLWQSWPYRLFLLMWTSLMGVETYNAIRGGTRMEDSEPWSGILANNIISVMPFFAIVGILVFSNQLLWRTRSLRIAPLVDSLPVPNWQEFVVKWLIIIQIPLSMLSLSIVLALGLQASKGWALSQMLPYIQLFYFLGVPLLFASILALSLQSIISRRFLGLAITALILLLTSSNIARLFGLDHLVLQYLQPIQRPYSEMNAYGAFAEHFHIRMLYAGSLSLVLSFIAVLWWPRGKAQALRIRFQLAKRERINPYIRWGSILFILTGISTLFYFMATESSVPRRDEQEAWQIQYESSYRHLKDQKLPQIEQLITHIDLYPTKQSYRYRGQYTICNPHNSPIEQFYMALDQVARLDSMWGLGLKNTLRDEAMGMFKIDFSSPLLSGESRVLHFEAHSAWSPFGKFTPFNAIVENGSFMRISRYYPLLGYQSDWEIRDEDSRKRNQLPIYERILALTAARSEQPYGDFIHWEATISTPKDQTVAAPTKLKKQWQKEDRAYFHFVSERAMPFRFALSSARFAERSVKKDGIQYQVFYHPQHTAQLDKMMEASQEAIGYYEQAFGPYPFDQLKVVEVSDFTEGFAATAYPSTLYIRENMGWYADPNDPDGPERVFLMMAHEIAHQWWGGQLRPEYREGATMLTESLAQYSAYMCYRQAFGEAATQKALTVEAELYFQSRGFQSETSLLKVTPNQAYVAYQKGAIVLYAIQELIGEENLNRALAKMLQEHAYPKIPATSLDMLNFILAYSPNQHHSLIRQWIEDVCVEDEEKKLIVRIE